MASTRQKVVIVGAGPVGSLAALYAASRGDDVEVYELRAGRSSSCRWFSEAYRS
jgi:kynurenine 3-monooxygenase